jgi:hypothetical protein
MISDRCPQCVWANNEVCPGQMASWECAVVPPVHFIPPISEFELNKSRHAIYKRFGRKKRIKIEDGSILCASDSRQFAALQMMLASVILSHDVRITLVDLGLLPGHREWIEAQGVRVVDRPELIMGESVHLWQNWNKPLWFQFAETNKVLWIDSDCIIDGDLRPIFDAIDEKPIVMRDVFDRQGRIPNHDDLYKRFPIAEHRRIRSLNNGVLGFDLKRDEKIISFWKFITEWASEDETLKNCFAWFDQGTFIYTCEVFGIEITDNYRWNDARPKIRYYATVYDTPEQMISEMPEGSTICHYLGEIKPYGWKEIPLSLKSAPDLEVLILGHEDVDMPKREFLEFVNLTWFDPDNQWSESRVYEQIPAESIESEYVGLASVSWVKKYEQWGVWAPWEFGELELSPKVVWVADDTLDRYSAKPRPWIERMDEASIGIRIFIEELRDVSGLKEIRDSAWSNNYVMHRDVYADLAAFHRRMKAYFLKTYGPIPPYLPLDPVRGWGYLAEAFSVHYLASRADLDLRLIRRPGVVLPVPGAFPQARPTTAPGVAVIPITFEDPIKCKYKGCNTGCSHYICKKYFRETDPARCKACVAAGGND